MSQMLTMTKTYLIDDYYESHKHNNHFNNNNNNLSFNKCVNKLGDIVSGHQNNINTRVRHYSQQQLANNVINQTLNRSQKINLNKDIDVSVSINSYESEEHINYISKRIELTLKEAKVGSKLNCTEILIPVLLTKQIGEHIIAMAETEPCGLRGCLLYINIEEKRLCRRLGEVMFDSSSVPTFEMYLTIKKSIPNWIDSCFDIVENKLMRKESVVLSDIYRLSKKKLYRSFTSS